MTRHRVATENPPDFAAIEIFDLATAERLAADLGSEADPRELQTTLNDRGSVYRWLLHHDRPSTPVRGELAKYADALDRAVAAGEALSSAARRALTAEVELRGPLKAANEGMGATHALMAALAADARLAREGLLRGGRPSLNTLRWLCRHLAGVYEIQSDRRFTYDAARNGFTSAGAVWVAKVAQVIDPEVTRANLATVLRGIERSQ